MSWYQVFFFTVVINRAEVRSVLIFHYSKFEINNEIVHYSLLNVKLNSLCSVFKLKIEKKLIKKYFLTATLVLQYSPSF